MFRLDENIENALIDWGLTETGLTTIWQEQISIDPDVGGKLPYPYLTMKIISGPNEVGSFDRVRVGDGIYEYTDHYEFTLQVEIVAGPEANLIPLNILSRSLDKPTVKQKFRAAGFSFKSKESILDTTELLETMYERRAIIDVFFGYQESIQDDNGTIEKVGITPTINGTELDEFIVTTNP